MDAWLKLYIAARDSHTDQSLVRVRGLLQRQWISVEERLPQENVRVFAYGLLAGACTAVYAYPSRWYGDGVPSEPAITHWRPIEPPNFRESSSLVPEGAESADIGKLDTVDKSGVEMGKVNRVDEKKGADVLELATEIHALNDKLISELDEMATAAAEYIAVPHVRHRDHLLACIRRAKTLGSAETGGEKAAWISVDERMPEDDDKSVWVCFENGSHYCSARWSDDQWWGYNLEAEDTFHIEQKITHWRPLDVLPTFPRPSQNQTVSSGVEGAHEGTTADEKHVCGMAGFNMMLGDTCPPCEARLAGSREPEKLNNAQKWTASEPLDYDAHVVKGFIEVSAPNDACFTALFPLRKDAEDYIAWKNSKSVALAESSLSAPPSAGVINVEGEPK